MSTLIPAPLAFSHYMKQLEVKMTITPDPVKRIAYVFFQVSKAVSPESVHEENPGKVLPGYQSYRLNQSVNADCSVEELKQVYKWLEDRISCALPGAILK